MYMYMYSINNIVYKTTSTYMYTVCIDSVGCFLSISLQPLFIGLAQLWSAFQDQVVVLSVLSNIVNSLSPFTFNSNKLCESEDFHQLLANTTVLTDDERKQQVIKNNDYNQLVTPNGYFLQVV